MSDPANRIALWGTIGTWLSPVYGPVVTSIWSYMVGFVQSHYKHNAPTQDIDLEAGVPSSDQVRKLIAEISLNTRAVTKHREKIDEVQQSLEEISKLLKLKPYETIPADPRETSDSPHRQAS
ncbi:uncharacterized protein TRUGW13939_09859 [Talaromyces rugulosus]|uniref:Uncharacterized protein n=1 Tax=Talaromyces rugulosus TaxID=121627 RepID=A0A7H8R9R8_TALRU|nr:uncharacterized protein TRUGW13939_09859 [Talaromyces rugulosus]QKX62698.1 hypothetical protein TRUGW13939_09859 [Talaromyces rugulosus]